MLVALCFNSCSNNDDTSSQTGTVSIKPAESTSLTEALTTTTKATTTEKETKKKKIKKTTTTEITTTEATTTEKITEKETGAQKSNNDFAKKLAVKYNNASFCVGDTFSSVKSKLGKQAAPSAKLESCIGSGIVDEYYYNGMTLQVNKGKIFSIDIMDNSYYGKTVPKTAKGIVCDKSTFKDVKEAYGNPTKSDDFNKYYIDGDITMQVSVFDGKVGRIWITDESLG